MNLEAKTMRNRSTSIKLEKQPVFGIIFHPINVFIYIALLILGFCFIFFVKGPSFIIFGILIFITLSYIFGTIREQNRVPDIIEVSETDFSAIWPDRRLQVRFDDITALGRDYVLTKGGISWRSVYVIYLRSGEKHSLVFRDMAHEYVLQHRFSAVIQKLNEQAVEEIRKMLRSSNPYSAVRSGIKVDEKNQRIKVRFKSYPVSEIRRIEFKATMDSPNPCYIFHLANGKSERWRFYKNSEATKALIATLLVIERRYGIRVSFEFQADQTLSWKP